MSISSTIKSIQDTMRKDVGVDGDAQRLSQLVWMLFLKIFDDRESEWELLQDHYQSPLPEKYRWRNWAANAEGMTGEALKQFIDNDMFPALQQLEAKGGDQRAYVIRSVFEDAYNYMKSGQLIRQVVNKIQDGIDFNKAQERHLFGDAYEQLLRDLQSAGNAGEFYTPRAVTEFMVRLVNPRLGEKIMDPACGTGGFLTCSIEHVRKQDVKTVEDECLMQASIFGIEKKPMPHLLCTTNMILHGIDVPTNIRHDNTLSYPLISWGPQQRVDVIVTNPPFGGMEEDGIENNFPATFRTRETADLFLVLIMQLLKVGGRAALVLPDGFLFGEGIKTRIKEKLLEDCNLHTIVRLPKGVFAPYTNIATNVLFFEKGEPTKDIWFFDHPYPNGYKTYSRSKPLDVKEFDLETGWWGGPARNGRKTTKNAWKVSAAEFAARNYNLDSKNPHAVQVNHRQADEVRTDYENSMLLVHQAQRALKTEVFTALTDRKYFDHHFDIAFAAIDGINRLRELVLTLGMQGKLIPQESNDQPASDLLKEIEAKKNRLVKEGVIKAPKLLPPLTVDERPYVLPAGWEWVKLGNIGTINPRNNIDDVVVAGFVPMPLIPEGYSERHSFEERLWSEIKKGYTHFADGDVGMAKITPCFENAKSCIFSGLPNGVGAGTTELHIFRNIYQAIEPRFLLYFLKNPRFIATVATKMTGSAGQKRVPTPLFTEIPLPLPPKVEQGRIVAKIGKLLELCDLLEKRTIVSHRLQTELLNAVMAQV